MGSVEELCDNITLINKSKTILEGSVHDIKMENRSNIFEIGYTGDPSKVLERLNGHCQVIDQHEERSNHYVKIRAVRSLSGNDMLNLVLSIANITSFNEIIPTMNEIFIKVVEAQNKQ
jgi:ABC-2 type transport system ATP-binding protein